MEIKLESKVALYVDEVFLLEDVVRAQLFNRVLNIDIFIKDIENAGEEFWTEYARTLNVIADLIIMLYERKKWNSAVNILTDPFLAPHDAPASFVMCVDCPCKQCEPNPALFEAFTGFENIPPQFYCRKSFIELQASRKIAQRIFGKDTSDIDEKDWGELCILRAGGMV